MTNLLEKCEGAMLGHALANNFLAPTQMALLLSDSLRTLKHFDPSEVMARYMYLYHTEHCPMGATTRLVYEDLRARITSKKNTYSKKHFEFPLDKLMEASQSAHQQLNGLSAGCNPAQRSFPLAFSIWIEDERLFETACEEAHLTHVSSQAGQVAGLVNLICRRLIKGDDWDDAVKTAFSTATNLPGDIKEILTRYSRDSVLNSHGHAAYAPNALHTALYCVTTNESFASALECARNLDGNFCLPLVGLLAGARWGVPTSLLANCHNDKLNEIRQTAKVCSEDWRKKLAETDGQKKGIFSKLFS